MENKNMTYAAILLIAVLAFGYTTAWTFNPANFTNPLPSASPGPTAPPGQITNPAGQVSVTKQIRFVGVDELAGSALDSTTSALVIYDSTGVTALETLSFSSGAVTSANSYPSGTTLWVYYTNSTTTSYRYWQVTVPTMGAADAESLTTNQITLKTREAGAYTDSLLTSSGLTITDGSGLNTTGTDNDTLTFTYNYYTTTDNTGMPSFTDPVYDIDVKNMIWATLSGTGYENVILTGFDGAFEKGTTMYYYKVISDNDVSKWKVGNSYVYPGASSFTFGFNAAGFGNTTTAYPTLQLFLKNYASAPYMQQMGDYGPYDVSGAEQTMLIYDIS